MVEILHSIRPEVEKFCWDDTIFKGQNDVPEEVIASHVEVQEEMVQKVTSELDQMFPKMLTVSKWTQLLVNFTIHITCINRIFLQSKLI